MTRRLLGPVILLLAITAAWAPARDAPFTYDDRIEVVGNRTIRWLDDVGAIASYNTSRPLLIATYAVNWRLGGLDPRGYHALSVVIHMVNVLLAWRLARRLVSPERAALAAAVWALHPMTTEAVTYITGRSDALEATSWLVAITAWIDHRRGLPRARPVAIAAVLAGLLTKEVGAALPLALLAVDRWLVAPADRRWRDHAPFWLAGAAAVALRVAVYGWPAAEDPRSALAQLLSQAEVWSRYLGLWLLPIGQSILHDHPGVARGLGAVALAGWGLATTLIVRGARGAAAGSPRALQAFGLVLWAAWLTPSSVVPLLETMAEHRSYFAGFALVLALVSVVGDARVRVAWALVPLLLAGTWTRNRVWADEVALWAEAAARNPTSARAAYGYGEALKLARRFDEAEPVYARAAELAPDDADPRIDLGIVRAERGDLAGARATWEDLLRRDPGVCAAHNNLGKLAFDRGELDAAAARYAAALNVCPDDPIAHLNLANLAWSTGDVRKAAWHYRTYLRVAEDGPAAPLARDRLGRMGVE